MARQYERMVRVAGVLAGPAALAVGLAAVGLVSAAGAPAAAPVVMALVALPLIALAWRRTGLPLPRWGRAGLPVLAVLGSAVVVFGVDAAAGGTRVLGVDPAALAGFLALNTVVALTLEALPEEAALRGLTFGSLAARPVLAAVVTTALFVVTPAAGIALAAGLGDLLGLPTAPATFAPGGQDPLAYALLLAVFGTLLATVRATTGSLGACVAVHLVVLTVNRVVLDPDGARTGVAVALPPGGEVLVLAYLALGAVVVLVAARQRSRRGPASRGPGGGPRTTVTPVG
jgi:uncharacterized protein